MDKDNSKAKTFGNIGNWLITIIAIFLSLSGILLSLICIYALPDGSVKPFDGSMYFAASSIVMVFLFLYRMKKERYHIIQSLSSEPQAPEILIKETLSDKIIKWIAAIFSFLFVVCGIALALICIYTLPDKTSQPLAGIAYFFSSTLFLIVFIFVVWKNWASRNAKVL